MTLQPLLEAPLAIKVHVALLVLAWLIGTWLMFVSRKGWPMHRALGVLFLSLITATAIVALFIHRKMPNSPFFGMSPTHLTVPLVLCLSALALYGALRGQILQHRIAVSGLYFGSLSITALVNVLTGDGIAHQLFFTR